MRIRTKLVLTLLILGIFPLLISGYVSYTKTKKGVANEIKKRFRVMPAPAANRIERLLYFRYNDTYLYSKLPLLREEGKVEEKSAFFRLVKERYAPYSWLGLIDKEGTVVASSDPSTIGINMESDPCFRKVLPGIQSPHDGINDVFFGDTHLSKVSGEIPVVDFCAPVFDYEGNFKGVVHNDVKMSAVAAHIVDLNVPHGDVYLLSRDNVILADLNGARADLVTRVNDLPGLGAMIDSISENRLIEGEHYLAFLSKMRGFSNYPGMDWKILVLQNRKNAYQEAETLARFFVWLTLAGGGGFIVLALFIAKGITHPIENVLCFLKGVKGAEDLIDREVKSNDEILLLERTIHNMFDKLIEQKLELEKANLKLEENNQTLTDQSRAVSAYNDMLHVILDSKKVNEVAEGFLENISRYLQLNAAAVFYSLERGRKMENLASTGLKEGIDSMKTDAHIMSAVIESNKSIFLAWSELGQDDEIRRIFSPGEPSKIVCAPIMDGDMQVRGLSFFGKEQFTDKELEFVNFASFIMGIGIEKVAAKNKLKELAADLRTKSDMLIKKNEELIKIDRMRGEFISLVSHELRTPLNAIIGFSEILLDSLVGELSPKQKECVGDILGSGLHLLQIVNDILDLSKIEAGYMEVEKEKINVEDEVRAAIRTITPLAEKKKQKIKADIGPDVKFMVSDRGKLGQILLNLLSNASKFSDNDNNIEVKVRREGNLVEFSVKDYGIGIDDKDAHKLFKPFVQVDSSHSRNFEGTGLGLVICKKLVEVLGGEIWFESVSGSGSTFFFTLEDASMTETSDSSAFIAPRSFFSKFEEEIRKGRLADSLPARLVLLFQTEKRGRKKLCRQLEENGYKVIMFYKEVELLRAAKMLSPDAVTLNINNPDADAKELIENLEKELEPSQVPVIIITEGNSDGESLTDKLARIIND